MKRVFNLIEDGKKRLGQHKLFKDLHKVNENDVEEKLKIWAPLFVHLTMTFRDINRNFLSFENPKNEMEQEITNHANVDSLHWKLLVQDLKTIGINDEIKNYQDAMEIIWSDLGAPIRFYMYHALIRAASCGDDVFLRMTAMESGETTVKMFFETTKYLSNIFEKKTGKKLHYFGDTHIDDEVDNAVEHKFFEKFDLDTETFQKASVLVEKHFLKFKDFLDYKYKITFE